MTSWLKGAPAVLAVIAIAIAAAVGFCAFSYRNDMRIDTARGVDEAGYVKIGGIDQWVQIRGRDRSNPVLLYLNGGPGFSQIRNSYAFRSWEKDFTLVMWDPRGQAKTFARSGTSVKDTMTLKQFTSDGIEVAEYLRTHLHKAKIILLGHSFGSMVGVHMVHVRPDLFYAYVGTGQVTNLEKQEEFAYPRLIERARKLGNKTAEQQLVAAGPPPYPLKGLAKWTEISWANELDPVPQRPPMTPGRAWFFMRSLFSLRRLEPSVVFSQETMWGEVLADDLPSLGLKFDVPVVMIQGSEDLVTPTPLGKEYFDRIEAPTKDFVLLNGSGHAALIVEPLLFHQVLVAHVRPLALSTGN